MYVYDVCSRKFSNYVKMHHSCYACHFYHQLVPRQQPGLQASHELGSCFSGQNAARSTRSSQPMTERVVNEELLNAPLTAVNYKDKFLHLNDLEMHEHEQCLERWALMLILAACMLCSTYSTVGKSMAQGDTFTEV